MQDDKTVKIKRYYIVVGIAYCTKKVPPLLNISVFFSQLDIKCVAVWKLPFYYIP